MTDHVATLRRLVGDDHLDAAIEVAVEAAKRAISVDQLVPFAKAWYMLEALGIPLLPDDSFWSWGRRNGIISDAQAEDVMSSDLLGMKGITHD